MENNREKWKLHEYSNFFDVFYQEIEVKRRFAFVGKRKMWKKVFLRQKKIIQTLWELLNNMRDMKILHICEVDDDKIWFFDMMKLKICVIILRKAKKKKVVKIEAK